MNLEECWWFRGVFQRHLWLVCGRSLHRHIVSSAANTHFCNYGARAVGMHDGHLVHSPHLSRDDQQREVLYKVMITSDTGFLFGHK